MADEMTSQQVAKRLGVDKSTVSRLVKGKKLRVAARIGRICLFDRDYIELFAASYERSPRGRKTARERLAA